MTPQNPWRRGFVRDTLIPVLWLLASMVLLGAVIGTCIAGQTG